MHHRILILISIAFALTVASANAQPVPWPDSSTPSCGSTPIAGGRIQRGDPRKPAVLLIHGGPRFDMNPEFDGRRSN
jgi:hypothetical protein